MSTRRFGVFAAAIAALFAGCPKSGSKSGTTNFKDLPLPPAVPTKIKTVMQDPMDGDTPGAKAPILDIMASENARAYKVLQARENAPAYYIAYQVTEKRIVVIESSGGALLSDDDQTGRSLDVEVRVGSPKLDNTRRLEDPNAAPLADTARVGTIPFGNDGRSIRHHLWLETDRRYREASDLLALVQNEQRVQTEKSTPPDFVHVKGEDFIQKPAKLEYDRDAWKKRMRECSKRSEVGVSTRSTCQVIFEQNTVYFVNTDGAKQQLSWTQARLAVSVGVKADDGMPLSRTEQAFASTPAELPGKKAEEAMIAAANRDLNALHKAPVVDPYVGPAILEGRAAAVFFHEVFGHRIEGHRQKDETSGQTFTAKVGQPIMPEWLSVYDDPRIQKLNGMELNGFYHFDDEGVRAQRAELVKSGVFVGFLQGRHPLEKFPASNGHGRKEPGNFPVVSRQGNLVVESSRSIDRKELEKELIREIERQGKPYGMIFSDISGGFTNTSRFLPQAFKVNPTMAYRLYPNGKRELVRGVDIVGTPLTALGSIRNAARPIETFNGVCGAESGWVPVSASAPSLLLERLEIERGFSPTERPPVLPPPNLRRTAP